MGMNLHLVDCAEPALFLVAAPFMFMQWPQTVTDILSNWTCSFESADGSRSGSGSSPTPAHGLPIWSKRPLLRAKKGYYLQVLSVLYPYCSVPHWGYAKRGESKSPREEQSTKVFKRE